MASYDLRNLGKLEQQYDRQLQECLHRKRHLEKMAADYEALSNRLSSIADKVTHEITVPLGSLAFMPGKIVHTNEITVLLGENWFVERSAKQAMDIVKRRMISCQNTLKDLDKEEEHILKWIKYSNEMKEDGELVDLVEEYSEEQERQWRIDHRENIRRHKKYNETKGENNHEDLMKQLDCLQIEEEETSYENEHSNNSLTNNLINFKHTETNVSDGQLIHSSSHTDVPIIQSPLDIYKHFGVPPSETKSILKRRDSLKDDRKNHVRFADEELAKPEKEYRVMEPKKQTAFSGVIVEKTELNVPADVCEGTKKTLSVFKQRKLEAQTHSGVNFADSEEENLSVNESVPIVNETFPNIRETLQSQNRSKTAFSTILERSSIEPIKPNELKETKSRVSKFKAQRSQK